MAFINTHTHTHKASMSEENHHHHHHFFGHHKKDEEGEVEEINKPVSHINEYQEAEESAIPIEKTEYYEGPPHDTHDNDKGHVNVNDHANDNDAHDDAKKHEKSATHKEHVGEAIGAAAVAFALVSTYTNGYNNLRVL